MVGQDPARFRRSTTATRFPCEASDQAKDLALPLPRTTTSYSSGCDTFFPLRVNSSRSFHASAATIPITTRKSTRSRARPAWRARIAAERSVAPQRSTKPLPGCRFLADHLDHLAARLGAFSARLGAALHVLVLGELLAFLAAAVAQIGRA